jgi:hypothetical protein
MKKSKSMKGSRKTTARHISEYGLNSRNKGLKDQCLLICVPDRADKSKNSTLQLGYDLATGCVETIRCTDSLGERDLTAELLAELELLSLSDPELEGVPVIFDAVSQLLPI